MKTLIPNGQIFLKYMNIEIQYIKNKNNVVADGFSRIIYKNQECATDETVKKNGCGNNQTQ